MPKSKSRVKKRLSAEADPFASAPSETPSSQAALEAVSIPPTVSDDVSDEPFFSSDSATPDDTLEDDDDLRREQALRQSPEVKQRIARARRIVTGLVAAAALVTFAGLGSKALRDTPTAQASTKTSLAAEPVKAAEPAKVIEPAAPKPVEAPKPPTVIEAAKPVEAPKPVEPAVSAVAEKPAEKPAEAAKPEAPEGAPTKTALEEKKDAQRLLDRGKSKDAIAAGERSVALDPADGEAWLLLGAAYQEQGKMVDARRCYNACIKEGKRGPKGECAAMLH